jgi:hypothetical protein
MGGNVLEKKDGKIILKDMADNIVSSVDSGDSAIAELDAKKLNKTTFDSYKSTAKERYGHSLTLDGTNLKLMNDKSSPSALSTVALPNIAGLTVIGFSDGVLQVKLSDDTVLDISASVHIEGGGGGEG